jgi:hypothetical protein
LPITNSLRIYWFYPALLELKSEPIIG